MGYIARLQNRDGSVDTLDLGALESPASALSLARGLLYLSLSGVSIDVFTEGGSVGRLARHPPQGASQADRPGARFSPSA